MRIQRPTIGRVVEYRSPERLCVDVGVIIHIAEILGPGVVDIRNLNTGKREEVVPHDADGMPGTWRYPPRCTDEIEVER